MRWLPVILLTCSCNNEYRVDQCLRVQLFEKCMKMLPDGPIEKQDAWSVSVIHACDTAARRQSKKFKLHIKPEFQ